MDTGDEYLKRHGLTFDELKPEERETFFAMVSAINQGALNIDKIRDFIKRMRDVVEEELTSVNTDGKLDVYLKARLRNLMLLDAFLTSPEKAKAQLDRMLSNISSKEVG